MRVAGFDPGITAAGFACIESGSGILYLLESRRIATKASDPLPRRFEVVYRALELGLRTHTPDVLGIEEQRGAQVGAFRRGEFRADNSKTSIVVGIAIGCATAYGVPWIFVTPQRAKLDVVGPGGRSADKGQVKRAVAAMCRVDVGELTEAGADAAAVAIAAGRAFRMGRVA